MLLHKNSLDYEDDDDLVAEVASESNEENHILCMILYKQGGGEEEVKEKKIFVKDFTLLSHTLVMNKRKLTKGKISCLFTLYLNQQMVESGTDASRHMKTKQEE